MPKYNKRKYTTRRRKYTKKTRKNAKKAVAKVKSLLYQNKLQRMLNKISVANHFFGSRSINEVEAGVGKVVLQNTDDYQPLALISLRSIDNNGENAPQLMMLKQSGHDFSVVERAMYMGSQGAWSGQGATAGANDFRQLIHRYTQIKLLFYQRANKKVTFTVRLCSFGNDLDPLNSGLELASTQSQEKQKRRLFYQYHCLRSEQTNPLLKNTENYTRDIKNEFNIHWSKTYTIDEQVMEDHGNDELATKQVNIFRKFDKIINFTTNANPQTLSNSPLDAYQDPEVINFPANDDSASAFPAQWKNLFLVITSNCTLCESEDEVNYDQHTFDVLIKNKYTAPAGRTMDST